ncbi:hypothetical protein SASPL_140099 [Salvia splendens]|uniref:DUF4378 domain-containing protein n=1 Tax=Salvia splendens TaxID=180675 RepID=A0A8X8WPD4_SALSN|nr:uncharacterized protein LOC121766571 [Salvia splendens]XP_042018774.1 uncharacterized protein LOC121766571 [Salvia splendens]KAG6398632.1 hypothetical protein SASPL_140099 [Salvia splendens]
MGVENQCSKGGNYIGGFLQMFDWNAKSRKKLFSSKSEVTEKSKQKKRCDGNSPRTHLAMMEMDEKAAVSSVGGSSDQSCASSLVDEDIYGTKVPGVVARLMGLDSLPKSSMSEPYSTPLFSSSSLRDAYYQTKNCEYPQESRLQGLYNRNEMELKYPRVTHKPVEKFQTETLPPKSAKSIPITHHKLLSPMKSAKYIPPKDAAHIMEAAARIMEPGPSRLSTTTKLPPVGASSVPLRVRGLKEKAEAAQKPSKIFEGSQRKAESSLRGNSMVKSGNRSVDVDPIRVMPDSDGTSSNGVKSNGKTISLALQAKANVQKRVGLSLNGNNNTVSQKDSSELSPNLPLKSQSTTLSPNHPLKSQSTTQKSTAKKQSMQKGSSVLHQNNQKQNCIVDRGKLSSKCNSKGGKTPSGESLSTRQRNSSKVSSTSRVNSRKLSSEVKDDKREALPSCKERVTSKKRSVDGNYHLGKNQAVQNLQMDRSGKGIQSRDITDRQSSWDQESGGNGTDVVSFTFKSPLTRLASDSLMPGESRETCKILSEGYQSKRTDDMSGSRFSLCGNNVKGGDALNTLLEKKLKELADKVEFSQQNCRTDSNDMMPSCEASVSSSMSESCNAKDGAHAVDTVGIKETRTSDGNISRARKLLDRRLPSPVSVLEHSSFPDSCSSSDTADSNSTRGSKQCSSVQSTELLDSFSSNTYLADEPDTELSDSASSTSVETVPKRQEIISNSTDNVNRRRWEFKYVKEMLSNIELKFNDYAVGRTQGIVNPRHFNQLESCNQFLSNGVEIPVIDQRALFDCVSECIDLRCRQFVGGGYRSLAKGLSLVRQEETFAQEVHREICGWKANIGDSMIDELVDKEMSNQYGRWVDFDVEAFEVGTQIQSQILNSLIDEVVVDIH